MRPSRVFGTTTFRLAAVFVAGFAASVAALGILGDSAGPSSVLYLLAALPLAVAALAALLPRPIACPDGTIWSLRAGAER